MLRTYRDRFLEFFFGGYMYCTDIYLDYTETYMHAYIYTYVCMCIYIYIVICFFELLIYFAHIACEQLQGSTA